MTTEEVLLAMHLLGISVWIGGQIVLAFLMPTLRAAGHDEADSRRIITAAAQRFQLISWAALVFILFTGIALMLDIDDMGGDWGRIFGEKLTFVVLSIGMAVAHSQWAGPKIRKYAESDPEQATKFKKINGALAGIGLGCAIMALVWGIRLFFA